MRITVDPYDRGRLVDTTAERVEVYLDGKRMDRVITADEEEDGKCAMTETLKGAVQVVLKPRGVSLQ